MESLGLTSADPLILTCSLSTDDLLRNSAVQLTLCHAYNLNVGFELIQK